MAFEFLSAGYPVETVKVRFELPIQDFLDCPTETFRGFLVNEAYVIYRVQRRELRMVKVKSTECDYVYLADGPSTSIGRMKKGERFQAFVYDLIYQLENVDGWSLLTALSVKESEINLTEVM
jgi:hypothetical protein